MSRPRVLVVGDGAVPTGFARVIHSVFTRLLDRLDIVQLGVNFPGDPHDWPWPIYRAGLHGEPFGSNRLVPLAEALRPDVILLVSDPSVVREYLRVLGGWRERASVRVAAYVPVERAPLMRGYVEPLGGLDLLVAYTEFGAQAFRHAQARIQARQPGFRLPPIAVVPHGVDTGVFHPLHPGVPPDRTAVRRRLFGDDEAHDAFIVLNANRNQPRKRIDVTIQGFAEFARDKPRNVLLFLHMGRRDLGWDVVEMCERHGLDGRLVMSTAGQGMPLLSPAEVNDVYNACDVGLNTASGEGWGLVAFEHAATGAAQVGPDHSAPAELWRGAAELLPPAYTLVNHENMEDELVVSPQSVAVALERLYDDRGYLLEMSRRAYENATRPEYQWDAVAERWAQLLLPVPEP
ncbi:MAG TPA: hypothetical protein VF006_23845 [Longimicrobium sp.]